MKYWGSNLKSKLGFILAFQTKVREVRTQSSYSSRYLVDNALTKPSQELTVRVWPKVLVIAPQDVGYHKEN